MADDQKVQQLIAAKETLRYGALHEATALQVRNYPYLIPMVSLKHKAETSIDQETRTVEFTCKGEPKFKFDDFSKECCSKILAALRSFLWADANLIVKVNGKVRFDSRK